MKDRYFLPNRYLLCESLFILPQCTSLKDMTKGKYTNRGKLSLLVWLDHMFITMHNGVKTFMKMNSIFQTDFTICFVMSLASHQLIWLWQSFNVEYLFLFFLFFYLIKSNFLWFQKIFFSLIIWCQWHIKFDVACDILLWNWKRVTLIAIS